MEGLRQVGVEVVGGKISGAVAKKLSNGDAIAEKIYEKAIEQTKQSLQY